MGIHNFQKFIKTQYPKSYQKKWLDSYDNLYIDLNHILHHVCYLSKNTNDILNRTKDYLQKIVQSTSPTKRVIIAADGPAPLAKLITQRKRRLDMVKMMDDDEEFNQVENLNLNLTPGTKFMMNLQESIYDFVRFLEITYNLEVLVDICNVDEGEIKIRRKLQEIQSKNFNDSHVVFSGDSDMILLLFTCHDLKNIYQIINKDDIISFHELYNNHVLKYGGTTTTKYDFTFINLLMGNDYLPKVNFIKLENIWESYKKLSPYFQDGLVNYNMFQIKIDPIFFHDLIHYATINTPKHLLNRFKISNIKDKLYNNYVEGLVWCFQMYITGKCSNYHYQYDHKMSPHFEGLSMTILFDNIHQIVESESINIDLYGILLIPEKANILLSNRQRKLTKKISKKHSVLYEEERCKDCKLYSQTMSQLNKENKLLDAESEEKIILTKKITSTIKKMANHKKIHPSLTSVKINEIKDTYNKCNKV